MQDRPGPSNHGPTVFALREAAAALGISRNTLRRRIAAGQVRAEQVERPQGFVWQVYLDGPQGSGQGSNGTVQQDGPGTVQHGAPLPPPLSMPASAEIMRAEAMATYTRSLLEPLVTRMAEQETAIRELEREVGELRAENRALVARTAAASPEPTTEPSPAPGRVWWFWLLLLAPVLVTAGVVAVVLLVVPR